MAVDPKYPPLPHVPIFDQRAREQEGSLERRLADIQDLEATYRFMSGNLEVTNDEAREVASILITRMLDQINLPLGQILTLIYYKGMLDGVLLSNTQAELDQKARVQ